VIRERGLVVAVQFGHEARLQSSPKYALAIPSRSMDRFYRGAEPGNSRLISLPRSISVSLIDHVASQHTG
jgi:hypothetical protein